MSPTFLFVAVQEYWLKTKKQIMESEKIDFRVEEKIFRKERKVSTKII